MKIPPLAEGYRRAWLRCRTCGAVMFYDFVPYSLSNPIRTTSCGHGAAERDLGCDAISADHALVALVEKATPREPLSPCESALAPDDGVAELRGALIDLNAHIAAWRVTGEADLGMIAAAQDRADAALAATEPPR